MFFYEGQKCPICEQYFAENEDIVACPQCGCPHHRICWQEEGHCHFADDHGTERQWAKFRAEEDPKSAPPTRRCPYCGKENVEFAEFCSGCGRDMDEPIHQPHQYTPPTGTAYSSYQPPYGNAPFGDVGPNEFIDGVPVALIAEVVGTNASYYLPRFAKMSQTGKKRSWNWGAFFFDYTWLLYRKNLLWGWLSFVFLTALDVLSIIASAPFEPFFQYVEQSGLSNIPVQLIPSNAETLSLILMFLSAFMLLSRLLISIFGNWLYMQNVLKKARNLMENPELRYEQKFLTSGGVSFAMAILPSLVIVLANSVLSILSWL